MTRILDVMRIGVVVLLFAVGCEKSERTAPAVAPAQTYPIVDEYFVECGCGCCGGVGSPEEPSTCMSREAIAKHKRERKPNKPEDCANVGCSRGTTYRVCDPKIGPSFLLEAFAPPSRTIRVPTGIAMHWRVGDIVDIGAYPFIITQLSPLTLDHEPTTTFPAGTKVTFRPRR